MNLQFSDKVERWPLERLIPHARNARTHSEEQVAQIAGSIAEFGFVNPVLVGDDGVIVAGHGRVMAARKLGLSEAPVIVLSHLTPTQRRALMIADNQITTNSGWDEEMLAAELAALKEEAFDLELLGFDDAEIDRLLAGTDDETADLDEAPEPPVDPVSRPGDLWICGEHRVLCGDATVLADVEKVLDGELADMTFCDPPYNVNYANTAKDKLRGKNRPILNDKLGEDFGALLYDACVNILAVTKGAVYICMSSSELDTATEGLSRGRRQVVDLRDLGQEHLHARALGLSAPIRADPLRLEGRHRSLLVWCARPGRRLVLRQAAQERPAPDDEAGRTGRARHPQLVQEPRHRARSVRRLRHDVDRGRTLGSARAAHRARSEVRRCHHPTLAKRRPAASATSTLTTGQAFGEVRASRAAMR